MLDIGFIRKNPDTVREAVLKRNVDPKLVQKFLRYDEEWRVKINALEVLKKEQNDLSKNIGADSKNETLLSRAHILKKRVGDIEAEANTLKSKRDDILGKLPNIPSDDVPVAQDESGNIVLRTVGDRTHFTFTPQEYLSLSERIGIIDVKKATEVTGSRFGYLLGGAALLEFALIRLAFDTLLKKNFVPVVPPVMIRPEVYQGMGRLAADQKEERYYISKDHVYLVGSAEHTLGPLHMNEVLDEETLPRRYLGFSTCFRREAGSYGKDTKGILRVHQFDKVEMFSFSHPEKSKEEHEFLLSCQEELMQKLNLPYRVVFISTGDMGWTDARQYDIETWLPGQEKYRETHSCSNTTDFQARGVNVKYRSKSGEKEFVHMLNATAFAIGRTIIAIIENYQTKKGTIMVPEVLQPYLGKKEIG